MARLDRLFEARQARTHGLDRDELRDLRKLRPGVTGIYVFETERAAPCRSTRCNTSSARWAMLPTLTSRSR